MLWEIQIYVKSIVQSIWYDLPQDKDYFFVKWSCRYDDFKDYDNFKDYDDCIDYDVYKDYDDYDNWQHEDFDNYKDYKD